MKLDKYHRVIAETPPEVKQEVKDYMDMLDKIDKIYKSFCKDTKRHGAILVHGSITEWHQYLASHLIEKS